jgi:peptidoglycan L-alanyl-D-glutamate endopeptidase CwlK
MAEYVDLSMRKIRTLNTKLIESATSAFQKCIAKKIPIYIIWGSRTIEQQELLYMSGRTMLGPIMTNRRPGYSAHNFGLALDFCLLDGKNLISWKQAFEDEKLHRQWFEVVKAFEAEGWESGWRWPSFEPGHLQNLMGYTIGELHNSYKNDASGDNWNQNV